MRPFPCGFLQQQREAENLRRKLPRQPRQQCQPVTRTCTVVPRKYRRTALKSLALHLEQLRDRAHGKEEPSRDFGKLEEAIFLVKRDGCGVDCIHDSTRRCEFPAVLVNSI